MMTGSFKWNSGAERQVWEAGWEGIRRATVYFWTLLQTAIGVSNPRPYLTPSLPGEPPRKRTGFLQANVLFELDKAGLKSRTGVSTNARYGLFLELGTKRGLLPRPWLLATLEKFFPEIKAQAESTRIP